LTLWDVPPDKLRAPDVEVKDFQQVLKHSISSVSEDELKRYDDWTTRFGQDG
jgi:vacuolar protein-sorting-associated protein 4